MTKAIVIDTNVLLVAEGLSTFSGPCRDECKTLLQKVQQERVVVLDTGREILKEYGNKLEHKKEPGMGHAFYRWLCQRVATPAHCETVTLTAHPARKYAEFPDHSGLHKFDDSDRKFVAVAAAHPKKPEIVQAGDSKWWGWRQSLGECGIRLNMPCEAELQEKWEMKIGRHA